MENDLKTALAVSLIRNKPDGIDIADYVTSIQSKIMEKESELFFQVRYFYFRKIKTITFSIHDIKIQKVEQLEKKNFFFFNLTNKIYLNMSFIFSVQDSIALS